ncbi:glycosyltransferase family 4 protein [Marinobacter sp.]|uniref:glycosyltransferase family 4 protein n=1 Tax=Marinobacter sp. TaxID=50741 RepID=UPI0035621183
MANSESCYRFLVPGDPEQRTGGYGYVREVVAGLRRLDREVSLGGLDGRFPMVDETARAALDNALAAAPDGSTVIVDGLALCGCPEAAEVHGPRLNLVALVHHPLADETGLGDSERAHFLETERRTLAAVTRVITTSETTARGLGRFGVPSSKVQVVLPGVHRPGVREDSVSRRQGAGRGEVRLLCVAHLSPRKAQLDLVDALARLEVGGWTCELAGSVDRDVDYASAVRARIADQGLTGYIRLRGELSGPELTRAFGQADLFVLPSHYEGYGMVIDEALAHGVPVISSDGGALAATADRPGCVTYPAGDSEALAMLVSERIQNRSLLRSQQAAARESAQTLRSWDQCAGEFDRALGPIDASLPKGSGFAEDWLRLREPADHQARDPQLGVETAHWLEQRSDQVLVVADIGAGSGSNWRYLRQAFPDELSARCQWHLYDQDEALLNTVAVDGSSTHLHPRRLEAGDLDAALPAPLHLVAASALIDLVSQSWLEAFAKAAAVRSAAVLVVLTYAGSFRLWPGHPSDDTLRTLVNQHQHGDKGTGAACGPEASEVLAGALQSNGYQVRLAPSTWHLDQRYPELQSALMEGWVEAARAQYERFSDEEEAPADWLEDWLNTRLEQAGQGVLTIEVDHIDLFGAPGL